jgi:hypothetical protein
MTNEAMTNEERAQRAEMALAGYDASDPEDLAATIVDLVTDLMHLAHRNDIEPDYIFQTSADHYTAEVEGEAICPRCGLVGEAACHLEPDLGICGGLWKET